MPNDQYLSIQYGHHKQRLVQHYVSQYEAVQKIWAGACEYITENGRQRTLTYLVGPEDVFAVHEKNTNGTENILYIQKNIIEFAIQ